MELDIIEQTRVASTASSLWLLRDPAIKKTILFVAALAPVLVAGPFLLLPVSGHPRISGAARLPLPRHPGR